MTKQQLIDKFARERKIPLKIAKKVVDTFFDEISRCLTEQDRIEIRGFGVFTSRNYEAYKGRNPKTGETVQVKPKKMPHFKAGKALKLRINNGYYKK